MRLRILLAATLLSSIPSLARDFSYKYEGKTVNYTVLDEEAKTVQTKSGIYEQLGNNVSGALVLPEHPMDGEEQYTLVAIGRGSFCENKSLTSVVIPPTVNSISSYAFEYCSSLESIEIPKSVTSIGSYAFRECEELLAIEIPGPLTKISSYSFQHCYMLKSVVLPESVESIGNYSFEFCSNLKRINIPKNVTTIGNYAFSQCHDLYSLEIPESVTSIGSYAFECSSLESIIIPNGVTSIADGTFSGCYLQSIDIPESVTSIGKNAFSVCDRLETVKLPETVSSIGRSAFSSCRSLKSIKIPTGVTVLSEELFQYCSNLESVILHDGITSIGEDAFFSCSSLVNICLPNSLKEIDYGAFNNVPLVEVLIPQSVKTINDWGFYYSGYSPRYYTKVSCMSDKAPSANNNVFSDYSGTLYVKSGCEDNYRSAASCWNNFKIGTLIEADSIILNETEVNAIPGQQIQLTAEIIPSDVTHTYMEIYSSDTSVATVDKSGLVTVADEPGNSSCKIHFISMYPDVRAVCDIKINSSGVDDVRNDECAQQVRNNDIYTLQGVCLKRDATQQDIEALSPGFYIVGGKKYIVK